MAQRATGVLGLNNTVRCHKMSAEQLIALSFNPMLHNKADYAEKKHFREGFQAFDATLDEFEQTIKLGIAFSYQYRDQKRSIKTFVASGFLAVDFDGGLTIADCLALDLVQNNASLIYSTASHTEDNHRFRLVFVLPRTIVDAKELRFASRALTERLGGDPAATDPARIFFGSKDCWSKQLGSEMSLAFLEELIEDGRLEVASDSITNTYPTGNRSLAKIRPDQSLLLADGSQSTFGQIEGKAQVCCPFHKDTNPSAFVSGRKDGRYLYCSACRKTWWSTKARPRGYNFHEFDEFVEAIKSGVLPQDAEECGAFEQFMEPQDIKPANISLQNEHYFVGPRFKLGEIPNGVTFIKSPKGSGKTRYLEDLLKQPEEPIGGENFDDDFLQPAPRPDQPTEKILLIGHRQALIGELCERLGLNCYLDYPEGIGATLKAEKKRRYGVCLDSLRRVEGMTYDLVVIDEVEQVLGHFLSSTIGADRSRIFEIFFRLVRAAKHVIVLDADLGWVSFNTIHMIKSLPLGEGDKPIHKERECPLKVIINERKDHARKLHLYDSREHLVRQLSLAALLGKRIFVTSNSKRRIEAITKAVEALAKQAETELPLLSITSTNSKTDNVQEFIRNISDRILDYSIILSSPSLGTGVDISFPNDGQEIDSVFGLFEGRITNHFEIDQQLARVRNPKEVHVWVSPQVFNFETDFEVVVDDLMRTDLAAGIRYGFGWKDRKSIADEDPFLTMAAQITVKDRASKNNLKANFIRHKRDQGWDITLVDKKDSLAKEGAELLEDGKALSLDEEVERVMEATVLDRIAFEKLKQRLNFENSPITEKERYDLKRTSFEKFYRQPAEYMAVDRDIKRHFRSKVLLFEALQETPSSYQAFKEGLPIDKPMALQRTHVRLIPDRKVGAKLLHLILRTTPAYTDGQFITGTTYSHDDLEEFVELSLKYKELVEGQFKLTTRKDIGKKPIQHFRKLLDLIGLRHFQTNTSKVDNRKIRHYNMCILSLKIMQGIARKRSETEAWEYLNAEYGFTYTEEDNDWLYRNT